MSSLSEASPFGKILRSVKVQKGNNPPSGSPQGAPAPQPTAAGQSAAAPAPVAHQPEVVNGPDKAQPDSLPSAAATSGVSSADRHPQCAKPVGKKAKMSAADQATASKLAGDVDSDVVKADLNGDGHPDFLITGKDCGNMRVCGTDVFASSGDTYVAVFHTDDNSFEYADDVAVAVDARATQGMCDLLSGGLRYSWNGQSYKANGKANKGK